MNDDVKKLLTDLGEAINRAVSESPEVDYVMRALKDSGYDAYMLLEAKIAVENKQPQLDQLGHSIQSFFEGDPSLGSDARSDADAALEDSLTAEDRRFLKYLKIEY